MKKILFSLMTMVLVVGLVGAGALAYFNDTETSSGNTFTTDTLDMKVDGQDDGATVVSVSLSKMQPGSDSGYYKWVVKNAGSIPGKLSVTFGAMTDNENGVGEPETAAEAEPYGYQGARATLGHPTDGELSEFLKPGASPDEINPEALPYLTILERNDTEGWWIGEVSAEVDTGGTCGWGPKGWSVPSTMISQWAVGPYAYGNYYGLKSWGGKTFTYGTLAPGAEIAFFFRVNLANDLQAWDGCGWHNINDNVIQSDGVVFDITFKLDQIP